MSKNVEHIQHIKSNVVLEGGKPKLPTSDVLVEGELAINYAEGYETLSIKNSEGNVVRFSSDNYYTEQKLGSGFTGSNSAETVTSVIEENEKVISAALNRLNLIKADSSAITEVSGAVSTHTANTNIHVTAADKTAWNAKLDATAYTPVTIDQVINSSTSASTGAVSTSAVYGFVTSYTPSITVDQVLDDTTSASTNPVSSKAVYDAVTDNELVWTNAYVTLSGAVSAHTSNTDIHVTAADKTAWNAKADASDIPSVSTYADSVKYNDTTHYMEFYHGTTAGTKVYEFDASPFIVDGMVQNVEIKDVTSGASQVTCLVISFNTDAGKQDINIPLGDIFDANNYYTKTQIDNLVGSGFTSSSITDVIIENNEILSGAVDDINDKVGSGFTSSSITDVIIENEEIVSAAWNDLNARKLDASAYTPTDLSNYYTKDETSGKTEISNALGGKVNSATFTAHTADSTAHLTSTEKSQLHTHSNKTYLDGITGSVGTMAYENASSYSSATQVSTALGDKADKATTIAGYGITDAKIANQVITLGANSVTVSSATQVNTALGDKADNSSFTAHTASTVHMTTTEKTNLDSLATNIAAISGISSTKVSNWDTAYTNNHTHSNKTYLDGITGSVGTMAYENASSYSSATDVNTALGNKANSADVYTKSQTSGATELSTALSGKSNTGHTHSSNEVTSMSGYSIAASGTAITTADTLNQAIGKLEKQNVEIVDYIEEKELAIAAALTDLDEKIGDIESILATI